MTRKEALRRLLQPKTVAVIGGDSAVAVVRNCEAIGFDGETWAVNPKRADIAGVPCVASIADLPGVPDASFVAAPPQASLQIIAELSALGAPGAVCLAAGFAEAGGEGEALQKQLREAAGMPPFSTLAAGRRSSSGLIFRSARITGAHQSTTGSMPRTA